MTCSHGGPLWFNCGRHFDFRLICSCNLLILHRALGSINMETCVWIPKASFCDNWLESKPAYIAKVFWRPSWILNFPPMVFVWTFTMSFCIIFFCILVTNLLNVYHIIHLIVLDVMAPVERCWYRHLVSTDKLICIILSRVHVMMFLLLRTCFQGQEHMYMTRCTTLLERK